MTGKRYVRDIVDNYCVIDTETTGLSSYYDEVIEIGLLKVRNNVIVEKYSQLIKPKEEIDSFITSLTGITNEMLQDMPVIEEVKDTILEFIGDDIIVGHNTSFDIRFLNVNFDGAVCNKYIDTFQFVRKLYPELSKHRLSDLTEHLNIKNNEHRALSDCISTKQLYDSMKKMMNEKGLTIGTLWRHNQNKIDISAIKSDNIEVNEDNFFFEKHVIFTGKLEKMSRKEAMQMVVNVGGILDKTVNKETNYLILGNNDYNFILKGKKSSKHIKVEKLKLEGQDINIIDEFTFYDIIGMN